MIKMDACAKEKCSKQLSAANRSLKNYMVALNNLKNDLKAKKINRSEFLKKLNKLTNELSLSQDKIGLLQCKVDHCQQETRNAILPVINTILQETKNHSNQRYQMMLTNLKKKEHIDVNDIKALMKMAE